MKIEPQVQKKYAKEILKTVHTSKTPLAVSEVLQKLQASDEKLVREIAVALVWHLLSTHKLQFDSTRRLKAATSTLRTATRRDSGLVTA